MARHELADQVAVLLQRAHPGELEKEDLEKESGLGSKDLRAALDSLSEEGELDPIAEHYKWRDPTGQDRPPGEPDTPDEADRPEEDTPLATSLEGADDRGRIILQVVANFPPAGDDEATVGEAQKIAEQVQNVLGTTLADLGSVVTVKRLEVFDEPRVLFDANQ